MRTIGFLALPAILAAAGLPALGQAPDNTPTPASPPSAAAPGQGVGAGAADQMQAIQKQLDDLTRQQQALQKQLDDLKSAQATPAAAPTPVQPASPGYGKLQIDGLAQVWIGLSNHPDPPAGGFNGYFKTQGFGARLRRLELTLNEAIDPRFSAHATADFARTSSTQPGTNGILQDLFMQYDLDKLDSVMVGQFKLPLSEVGLHSSAHLPTIERPLFVVGQRNFVKVPAGVTSVAVPLWGDIRETGLQFRRMTAGYTLQGAITQGAGDYQNSTQPDYGKQFTGQAFWRPTHSPDLQLGITGSAGSGFLAKGAAAAAVAGMPAPGFARLARIRGGGSLIYSPGRWYLESEYMGGTDGVGIINGSTHTINAHRHGEYGILGYDLGGYRQGDGYQVVVQEDYWDPGIGLPRQTNTTLGLNHDLDKGHRRLQLNYVHQHYDGGSPAPASSDNDQLIAGMEANW